MVHAVNLLKKNIEASIQAKTQLLNDSESLATFSEMIDVIISCYEKNGRLYIAGNGGSAADAQHLAAEFVSKLARDRAPLPAEALTVDSSILTAIGNDYGYDLVFSRQLIGKATARDVFLVIKTSGRSQNIIKAIEACKILGIPSIIFCGRGGGDVKSIADYCLVAPGIETSTIQELHIVLAHTLCECVESAILFEKNEAHAKLIHTF
jgi:D-sedoheptulose 7-phosphate isomerase